MFETHSPMIHLQHVGMCFEDTWVHKDLNFTVRSNEIIAIVGASGSGKSTLLREMLLLTPPTEGEIQILGQSILTLSREHLKKLRQKMGVMYQQGALFSALTVLENIIFPLKLFTSLSMETMVELAMIKLEMVGLAKSAANKKPSELSGGMIKRVAVARALAADPPLLFLDEPTAGLDPKGAEAFDDLLLQLHKTLHTTIVMVTHDVDTLYHVPHRVAYLGEGKMLAVAPLVELKKNPHPLIQAYFSGRRSQREII